MMTTLSDDEGATRPKSAPGPLLCSPPWLESRKDDAWGCAEDTQVREDDSMDESVITFAADGANLSTFDIFTPAGSSIAFADATTSTADLLDMLAQQANSGDEIMTPSSASVDMSQFSTMSQEPLDSTHRGPIIKQGWMWKRSRHLKAWRKRWFVMTPYYFACFRDEHDVYPTECIDVEELLGAFPMDDFKPRFSWFWRWRGRGLFAFCILCNGCSFQLTAGDSKEKLEWMSSVPPRRRHNP